MLSYVVPASAALFVADAVGFMAASSLLPRLWPGFLGDVENEDALDETVLVRLGACELNECELNEEFEDVVDPCLRGLGVGVPISVGVRLSHDGEVDITDVFPKPRMHKLIELNTTCLRWDACLVLRSNKCKAFDARSSCVAQVIPSNKNGSCFGEE